VFLLKHEHPHDTSVLLQIVCWGEDYRLKNDHKPARSNPTQTWGGGGGILLLGLINAPLGFLPVETSTNISIIT